MWRMWSTFCTQKGMGTVVTLMTRNLAIAVCFLEQHNSPLFQNILFHFKRNNFHRKPFNFSFINNVRAGKKKYHMKDFLSCASGPNPAVKEDWKHSGLAGTESCLTKPAGSPGLWKYSALGSIWFQYQQL